MRALAMSDISARWIAPFLLAAAALVAQACAHGTTDDGSYAPSTTDAGGTPPTAHPEAGAGSTAEAGDWCGSMDQPCCGNGYCHGSLVCLPTDVCVAGPGDDGGAGDDGSTGNNPPPPEASDSCTTQGLTACGGTCTDTSSDPHSCGACGHDCQGGACSGGLCATIVLSSQFVPPGRLTMDSKNVYWTNADGTVRAAPIAGGSTTTLAQGLTQPTGVAVDAQDVYATSMDGRIVSAPLAGSDAGALTTLATAQPNPYALTVDATDVYWSNVATGAGNGSIMACAKSGCGGAPATLASGIHVQYPYGIVAAGGALYWTSFNFGGELNRVPTTGGGGMTTVGNNLGYPYEVAFAGSTLLTVLYGQGGGVATVPSAGGAATHIVGGQSFPTEGTTDGTSAYWTLTVPSQQGGATLLKCALSLGALPQVLATGVQPAGSVVVDATWVYWLSNDGTVLKTAK
jgi:hypothetical protein